MITSLRIHDTYDIKVNTQSKFKVGDNVLSADKDIPFVRYHFDKYTDSEILYIKGMKTKFSKSTHLAEVMLNENTCDVLGMLNEIENVAKYVYYNISEETVQACGFADNETAMFKNISIMKSSIDRIMLKDKSSSLDLVTARKIIKQVSTLTGVHEDNIGICSSPISFGELACLTAVRARELMSKYSTISDVALPSANHQCMNCCGCIRYIDIMSDTELVEAAKTKAVAKKSEPKEKTEKSNTKVKVRIQPGRFNL